MHPCSQSSWHLCCGGVDFVVGGEPFAPLRRERSRSRCVWLARPPAHCAAMPRSKKKGAAAKSGPQSAEWVQSAAAGFDAEYHGLQAGQMPSEHQLASAVQAVDPVPPAELAGSPGSASGATEVPVSQARLGAVHLHRHSGEGLTATGFEPERHSVMVLGRPVQASPPSAANGCCDGCYLLPDSLSSTPSPQASPCCTEPFAVQCCFLASLSGLRCVSCCGTQSLSPRAQPS